MLRGCGSAVPDPSISLVPPKKIKDPNAPKRPLSAFLEYVRLIVSLSVSLSLSLSLSLCLSQLCLPVCRRRSVALTSSRRTRASPSVRSAS